METLQIICKLIQDFMKLDDRHIAIYNQKWLIPKDNDLFVCVGLSGSKILSNNSYHQEINGVFNEILEVQKQDTVSINIYSYDMSAIDRKEEILMALNNDAAKNMQTSKNIHIARIPINFTDVSEREGTKILNRFNITLNVISKTSKIISSDYFDKSNFLITKDD